LQPGQTFRLVLGTGTWKTVTVNQLELSLLIPRDDSILSKATAVYNVGDVITTITE
jgi:hypothetical protein